jgi:hypothetical protein
MGEYFLVVNPVKRQFLDAIRFGESIKRGGLLQGKHGIAVALLLLDTHQDLRNSSSLVGSWMGDPIIITGDSAVPHTALLQTATVEQPERNLYAMALEEFEDISHRAIVMVCEDSKERIDDFVNRAKEQSSLLVELGDIVFHLKYQPLKYALTRLLGIDWTRSYRIATKDYHLRRLIS